MLLLGTVGLEAVADGKKSRTTERQTALPPQNTEDDF